MRVIGLTGDRHGQSNAARVFRRAHIPVFDADAAVHRLQARGGAAVAAIGGAFPGAVADGAVDRAMLRRAVLGQPEQLRRLEAILHPMVRAEGRRFIARHRRAGARLVVMDIPLLFETGRAREFSPVVVVSAPRGVQRQRLARRGGMSAAQIAAVLARQMPDAEKRARADVVIRTGLSRHHAQRQLRRLILACR